MSSPKHPKSNSDDGIPSILKLIKRPKAKPNIKRMLEIVAAFQ